MSEQAKDLELSVTRFIAASPEAVYRIWTERPKEWFVPKPWTIPAVEYDLRPGGRAYVEMAGPDGEAFPNDGVFLEVVPNERIVTTNLFTPGWNPHSLEDDGCGGFGMVAITTFEPEGNGTRYTARARHWTDAARKQHESMGFNEGWGIVADQLAELAED